MNYFDKYCRKIEKKTLKLIFKMFRYKNIEEAIKEENKLEMELEKSTHKEISLIEFSDIKHSSYLMLNYCKYKTLDEIISVYLNLKKLNLHSKDYINEVEK